MRQVLDYSDALEESLVVMSSFTELSNVLLPNPRFVRNLSPLILS